MIIGAHANMPLSIPVVDLSAPEADVVKTLKEACEEYGFFYVTNHGAEKVIETVFDAADQFFSLAMAEKMKLAMNSSSRGYVWVGGETCNTDLQCEPDTKENFQFGEEYLGPDFKALREANIWPSQELLPGWRRRMLDYYDATVPLAMRLCRLLALSLGLPATHFTKKFTEPMSLVCVNRYSERRSDPGAGLFGCGEHTDWDVMTLLTTDDVPGLEVRLKDGSFLPIEPRREALICNLGDSMAHLTNDRYRSAPHRVINLSGRKRTSFGLFFRPNFDELIDCLPSCCDDAGNPKRYEPITFGEYIGGKFRNNHATLEDQE